MKLNFKKKEFKLELINGEVILKKIFPSNLIFYDPLCIIIPIIFIYVALDYYKKIYYVTITMVILAILYLAIDYILFKSTTYIITNRRIVILNNAFKKMQGMPISAVEDIGYSANIFKGESKSLTLKDKKGNSLKIKGIKEWKEIIEIIYKQKYGENVIINYK
ncbi:MAG: hypothetical protein ACPLVI_06410 [Thermoplasmata archaeon]|jgi:hypothetical protein